jgi:hypothetical protein
MTARIYLRVSRDGPETGVSFKYHRTPALTAPPSPSMKVNSPTEC